MDDLDFLDGLDQLDSRCQSRIVLLQAHIETAVKLDNGKESMKQGEMD